MIKNQLYKLISPLNRSLNKSEYLSTEIPLENRLPQADTLYFIKFIVSPQIRYTSSFLNLPFIVLTIEKVTFCPHASRQASPPLRGNLDFINSIGIYMIY